MEQVLPEVGGMICEYLDLPDIINLRLSSRHTSYFATPYFFPSASLVFTPASFQRLMAISKHPVISRYVNTLNYKANSLKKFHTRDELQAGLRRARDYRLEPITSAPSEDEYCAYQEMIRLQDTLRAKNHGTDLLRQAMLQLPGLKEVVMLWRFTCPAIENYLRKDFNAALRNPSADRGSDDPAGVAQFRSALLTAHDIDLKLSRLELLGISWHFFKFTPDDLGKIKRAMRHLRDLEIRFTLRPRHRNRGS